MIDIDVELEENTIKRQYTLDKNKMIPVSERKLEPKITIGFANKAPRFIVLGKHCIGLEERKV